jgi:hypothetical protein
MIKSLCKNNYLEQASRLNSTNSEFLMTLKLLLLNLNC